MAHFSASLRHYIYTAMLFCTYSWPNCEPLVHSILLHFGGGCSFCCSCNRGKRKSIHTGCIKRNEQGCLLNISATKYLIFKSFFSSENWDPYANFEYKTISVRLLGVEIFAKQNGILIKTQIIWYRALTYFENVYDKNSYNIYQSVWVTRPPRSHLGAIQDPSWASWRSLA